MKNLMRKGMILSIGILIAGLICDASFSPPLYAAQSRYSDSVEVYGTVRGGRNIAASSNGGQFISASSEYAGRGGAQLIDGITTFSGGGDYIANGTGVPAWVIIAFQGAAVKTIDAVVLYNQNEMATSYRDTKDFRIGVSTTDTAAGSFTIVYSGQLRASSGEKPNPPQVIKFTPVSAKYVKLYIDTIYVGGDGYPGMMEMEVYEAQAVPGGNAVSARSISGASVYARNLDVSGDAYLAAFSGNVGIGTTSPGQKLQVTGIIHSTTGGIMYPDGSTQTSALVSGGWTKTGSSVYVTSTSDNVGIGTTSPGAYKLNVQGGDVNFTGSVLWSSGGSANANTAYTHSQAASNVHGLTFTAEGSGGGLDADFLDGHETSYFQTALTNPVTGTGTTNYLPKFTGASAIADSLIFDNGTNVGIGSATPGQKLDVNGSINITSGQKYKINNVNLAAADVGAEPTLTKGNLTAGTTKVTIGGAGTGAVIGAGATVDVNEANLTLNNIGGTLGISKGGTGATTFSDNYLLKGKAANPIISSIIYDNGTNVGIGTDLSSTDFNGVAAGKKLVVAYSSSDTGLGNDLGLVIRNTNTTTNNTSGIHFSAATGASSGNINAIDASIVAIHGARTSGQYQLGALAFLTTNALNNAPAERMRIDTAGNVGIGTASPGASLDLNGDFRFTKGASRTISIQSATSFTAGDDLSIAAGGAGSAAAGKLYLTGGNATNAGGAVHIYGGTTSTTRADVLLQAESGPTGNVGIGITAPGQKLQVAGIIHSTTGGIMYPDGSTQTSALASGGWTKSGSTVYVTTTTDNIGVGTTAPAAKFNVLESSGTVHGASQGSVIIDHDNNGGGSSIVFRSKTNRSSDYGYIQYQDDSVVGGGGESARLLIGTSNDADDHIALMPTGNVGIGTASPGVKLDVSGDMRTNSNLYVSGLRFNSNGDVYLRNYSGNNTSGGMQLYRNDGSLWGSFYGDGSGVGILNGAGQWAVLASGSVNATNTNVSFYTSNTQRAYFDSNGLTFLAASPNITTGGSYIVVPSGANISGGTLYVANQMQARGGIHNDNAATLDIAGGTGGYTNFSAGNVGIGIAAPTYRLQIGTTGSLADSIRIGSYAVSNNTRQYIGYARADTGLFESAGDGDTPSTVKAGVSGIRIVNTVGTVTPAAADNSVQLLTHIFNGNSRVALHANYDGNVGIGTTTPGQKLQVTGIVESTTGGFKYPDSSIQTSANSASGWTKSGAAIYATSTSDNVGIGTTSPGAPLDVGHSGAATYGIGARIYQTAIGNSDGPKLEFKKTMTTPKSWAVGMLNGVDVGTFTINEDAGATAGFGTSRLAILAGGNVGIGTTAPGSYKLNVQGGPANFSGAITASQFNGSGAGLSAGSVPISALASGNYSSLITSGTYNINITGNAATATNVQWTGIQNIPGYDSKTFAGNWGQHDNHGAYTDFSIIDQWGATFVQGNTNGPTWNGSSQNYQEYHSLGANYGPTTYGMQTTIPRNVASPYFSVRFKEGSVWGAWSKISAGFADTATTATNLSGGSISATTGTFSGDVGVGGTVTIQNDTQLGLKLNTSVSSLLAANWYRIATLSSTNAAMTVKLKVATGARHTNTIINIDKGTGYYTAEVYEGGRYVYAQNIKNVRIVDAGVNQPIYVDVQVGSDEGAVTYTVLGDYRGAVANGLVLNAFVDQGAAAAGHVYPVTSVIRSFGDGVSAGPVLTLKEGGLVGIGTTSPDRKLVIQEGTTGEYQLFLKQNNANHGYTLGSSAQDGDLKFARRVDGTVTETVRFTTGGNVTAVGNIKSSGGGSPNIVSAGSTSTDGMLFEGGGSYRPALVVRGSYPHIELWSDIANDNHGATLRFGGYNNGSSGAFKHWVIGTPGSNLNWLDFGYAADQNNPHMGISGYTGTTIMRLYNNGNVGIGNFGTYGSLGDTTPDYTLDVRGTGGFSGRLNFGTDGAVPYNNPTGLSSGMSFGGWESSSLRTYGIFTELENVGGNYSKLTLNWHTGIRIGAYSSYGGIRFYDNYAPTGNMVFSVAQGDSNVRVTNNLYVGSAGGWVTDLLNAKANSSHDHYYTLGTYIGGGTEAPNYFGSNKLKLQMLAVGSWSWSDTLWMSSYAGGDVKGSNQLVFSKYGANAGFRRQDYDSGTWGTLYEFIHTGNIASQTVSNSDMVDGYHYNNLPYAPISGSGNYWPQSGWSMSNSDQWPTYVFMRNGTVDWDEGMIKGASSRSKLGAVNAIWGPHMGTNNSFGVFSTGWDNLFEVKGGSGNVWIKGNVGIGVASAGRKLDVLGDMTVGNTAMTYIALRDDESPNGIKYIHANSNVLGFLNGAGSWMSYWDNAGNQNNTGTITAPGITGTSYVRSNGNVYTDANYGYGLVGAYSASRYQGVYAMGDAYKLPADGTTTGNLYGLAWSHPNAGGVAGNLNTHGLLVMENGTFLAAVSGSIRARDDMRAPVFYDSNDAGYYVDGNNESRFYRTEAQRGWGTWVQYDASDTAYYVDPNGTSRFNDLRGNIFYDGADTGYYVDPNGTSNLYAVTDYTRAAFNLSRTYTNRRNITGDQNYWTGTNGWATEATWDTAWKYGFGGVDIWGTSTGHPQGAGYVHAQGIISGEHIAYADGSQGYGWMMVGAASATENRYWLRGKWGGSTSGWVEMITSGNIGSQTVATATNNVLKSGDTMTGYLYLPYSLRLGEIVGYGGLYRSSGDMMFYTEGAAGFRWRVSNVEKMYLDSSGNLTTTGGDIKVATQGLGLRLVDETSATNWQLHSHGDRLRTYNGSTELTYLTTGDAVANADTVDNYHASGLLKWNTWDSGNYYQTNGDIYMGWAGNWLSGVLSGKAASSHNQDWSTITGKADWLSNASYVGSHSNANEWRNSGFYENGGCGSNWPSCTWYNSINVRHSNQGNYHGFQVAMSYYDNFLWFRSYQGSGTFQPWVRAVSADTSGNVSISGTLTVGGYIYKNGGGFQIDHPLDPANKVLVHSFVESPDMKNLYDGVVVLDANGESIVQLPDWFGALNRDFRYQLTPIGKPGMSYIKEEIKDNRFVIAGNPGLKVSWQVTGTRQDAYAEKHRIKVEEEKGSRDGMPKKGEYIAKDCYGEKE